jgi:hypothetical protein
MRMPSISCGMALVEPQRRDVVVGGDQPDPAGSGGAGQARHLVQQRSAGADPGDDGMQRDDLP